LALTTKLIVNLTRERCVCVGELADGPLSRMRGLLGRSGLANGEGMLLSPAPSIHTAFMRFPIDAVFLDRELQVLGIVEQLRPWRVASRRKARAVLELAAGESARCGLRVGDRLGLCERRARLHTDAGRSVGTSSVALLDAPPVGDLAPETASESVIWPHSLEQNGGLAEHSPVRVLVISRDRHFRSVTSMLLTHRGCSVTTTAKAGRVSEIIDQDGTDVVVVDAGHSTTSAQAMAAIGALTKPVGLVVVDDAPTGLQPLPVVAKWGPFDDLFAAIERADRERGGAQA
jgi:uncharacterized membrane protein (UPF0127 family)/CheY-like chemotaxis protein